MRTIITLCGLMISTAAIAADPRSLQLDGAWFDCMVNHLGSLHVTAKQDRLAENLCGASKTVAINYKVETLGMDHGLAVGDTEYPLYRILSVR